MFKMLLLVVVCVSLVACEGITGMFADDTAPSNARELLSRNGNAVKFIVDASTQTIEAPISFDFVSGDFSYRVNNCIRAGNASDNISALEDAAYWNQVSYSIVLDETVTPCPVGGANYRFTVISSEEVPGFGVYIHLEVITL